MSHSPLPSTKTLLALAILGALANTGTVRAENATVGATDTAANANEEASDLRQRQTALEGITVTAQRTTLEMARAAQEEAPNIVNLMTADEIQKLPDVNTGEAIRRVPGISLETDTGEGRYINIRGLDADLNSTTFGGLRLPPTNNSSPSGAGRAVAFDSIPVGFVGAITVTKSNLPEQDAEALGGTIDITPKTAPADGKAFADLKLGTGLEVLRHSWVTDGAVTAGTRFGGSGDYQPFSILVTAAVYTDRRGVDDAEAGFVDAQPTTPDKAFSAFEQRYYNYHRERHGYGFDFGFQPNNDNKWYVRYYDAGYSETVLRNRLIWNYAGAPTVDPNNPNGFVDTATFTKTLRDEKEYLKSRVFAVGGKNSVEDATLDYHVGYTKGTYEKPYDINSSFDNPTTATVGYDNTTHPNWPSVSAVGVNPADPSGYVMSSLYNQSQHSDDHEWGIGANVSIPTHWTNAGNENIKFGLNARLRNRTASATNIDPSSVPAVPLSQVIYGDGIDFYQGHYQNGPQINAGAVRALFAGGTNPAFGYTADDMLADQLSNASSYQRDKENVYAAYGQYQFGFGPLGIIAGARVENTKATYAANLVDTPPAPAAPTITPVSQDKSYTNFFPTAQARYEFAPDLIGRAAVSSTIARPGFNQVTASTSIDPSGSVSTGNPQLKPTTATGLDLSIEKYLTHAGIMSLGVFDKEIKNYIVTDEANLPSAYKGGFVGLAKTFTYTNASKARAYGVEANYVQRFRDLLPGFWSGFGVSANWTWVDSKYTIPVAATDTAPATSRPSVLPSTSRNTANVELLYELRPVNMTLGAYYVSKNIFGVGQNAATDIWSQERVSVDFGSQYQITDPFSVYFNAKNLTNTALKFTEGAGEDRVIQREFYGITLQLGANYKF
jgi:TonB-dependent receptor